MNNSVYDFTNLTQPSSFLSMKSVFPGKVFGEGVHFYGLTIFTLCPFKSINFLLFFSKTGKLDVHTLTIHMHYMEDTA